MNNSFRKTLLILAVLLQGCAIWFTGGKKLDWSSITTPPPKPVALAIIDSCEKNICSLKDAIEGKLERLGDNDPYFKAVRIVSENQRPAYIIRTTEKYNGWNTPKFFETLSILSLFLIPVVSRVETEATAEIVRAGVTIRSFSYYRKKTSTMGIIPLLLPGSTGVADAPPTGEKLSPTIAEELLYDIKANNLLY